MEAEDTYFLNYDDALGEAKKQNRYGPYCKLQLCYYNGLQEIKSKYKNLIYLPIDEIEYKLLKLETRVPTKIYLEETNIPKKNDLKIQEDILSNIRKYKKEKEILHNILRKKIKRIDIDFTEKLRIYIATDKFEKDARTAYENIRDAFIGIKAEVFFDINDDIDDIDDFRRAKFIEKYKPHITININRLRNTQLPEKTLNIIWFIDPTLILYDDSKIQIRKNDFIFSSQIEFENRLLFKNVDSNKIKIQPIPGSKYCFINKKIKREEKIVFVGSNFFEVVELAILYKENKSMIYELTKIFNEGLLTREKLNELADKYVNEGIIKSHEHLNMFVYPAIGRLEVVKWLCSQSKIKFEVYGKGWDKIKEVSNHYKGILEYKEVVNLYNSAKYSLIIPSHSFYQKRLLEASACGCINIAFDDPNMLDPFYHKNNVLLFKDSASLLNIIGKKPKKDTTLIANDISYKIFINKIINLNKEVNNVR